MCAVVTSAGPVPRAQTATYARLLPGLSWPSWRSSWSQSSSRWSSSPEPSSRAPSSWPSWLCSWRRSSSRRASRPPPPRSSQGPPRGLLGGLLRAGGLTSRRLGRLDTALESREQVHDLAGLRLLAGGLLDLAALELGRHQLLHRGGVVVLVLVRVVVTGEGLDEHPRHLQLVRLGGALGRVEPGEVGLADLVGPQHRLEDQHVVAHPQHRSRHPVAQRHRHHGHPVRLPDRLAQQGVGLGRRLVGLEVVGPLQHHRVDLLARHELVDRDLTAARGGQLGEVLVVEDHHLAVTGLVALGDVGVLDLLAVDAADPLVLDPAAVLGVDLTERDVVALRRGVEPHRHTHETERDCTLPDGPHRRSPLYAVMTRRVPL